MTMYYAHHGEMFGSRGLRRGSRFAAAGVTRGMSAALKTMHRAIVAAKLRRLRNELMLKSHSSENFRSDERIDVSRFPQLPSTLGEKWDY